MKKFKLNLTKDFSSLKNNSKNLRNPLLREAAISLVGENQLGGTAFSQSFGRSFSQSFGRSVSSLEVAD